MKNRESKIKLWEKRISAWETSGESMRKFCLKRSLASSTFKRWKKILRKNISSSKLYSRK